jgi:hypothetical protein
MNPGTGPRLVPHLPSLEKPRDSKGLGHSQMALEQDQNKKRYFLAESTLYIAACMREQTMYFHLHCAAWGGV